MRRERPEKGRIRPDAPSPAELFSGASEVLAASGIYPWVWTIPENLVFVHPALADLFALDPGAVAGGLPAEAFAPAIHEEDRQRVAEAVERAQASGERYASDYRVRGEGGRVRWVAARGRVEYGRDGAPSRFSGVLMEATERKQVEGRLSLQHAVTSLLVRPRPLDGVMPEVLRAIGEGLEWSFGTYWRVDEAAKELRCERAWQEAGFPSGAFEELTLSTVFEQGSGLPGRVWKTGEPEWIAELCSWQAFPRRSAAEACGLRSALAFPVRMRTGIVGVMEFFSRRPEEPDPELLKTVATLGNLVGQYVERRRIEASLKRSENRYRSLVEASTDMIWVTDAEGRFVAEQPGWGGFTGQSFEEYRGFGWLGAIHPDDRERTGEAWLDHVHRRAPIEIEYRARRSDGEWRNMRVRAAPVTQDGELVEWVGVEDDVTERRRVEEERERLLRREREISLTLQRSLLPPSLPEIPGVQLAARYVAAGEGMEVGGDFYDAFSIPEDHWELVVGDVTGKGPEAAALTSLAHYTIRTAAARERGDPGRVVATLNEEILRQIGGERLFTVVYGEMEPAADGRWELSMATGGHPSPIVSRSDGRVESFGPAGMILGATRDARIGGWKVILAPGDAVVLYTDGATEARDGRGEFFGEERLRSLCHDCAGLTAEEIATRVEAAVAGFQDGPPRDDLALLVVRVTGAEDER